MNFVLLLVYGLVVAVVARTVTTEEIFAELRAWAKTRETKLARKLAYPLTCHYCFSHWVSAGVLALAPKAPFVGDAGASLVLRVFGFFVNVFLLVAVANAACVGYERLTLHNRLVRAQLAQHEEVLKQTKIVVEEMEIKLAETKKLVSFVAEHNAKIEEETQLAQAKGMN